MLSVPDHNPYRPPSSPSRGTPGTDRPRADSRIRERWDRRGRVVIVAALLYMAIYFPYFLLQVLRAEHLTLYAILPAHFVGMALNLAALIMTLRDLWLRPFTDPNAKVKWAILILATGGIGWLVYVFRYPLKPRSHDA